MLAARGGLRHRSPRPTAARAGIQKELEPFGHYGPAWGGGHRTLVLQRFGGQAEVEGPAAFAPGGEPAPGRHPRRRKLRTKLTFYSMALFSFVLCAIVTAVYVSVERNAERVVSHELAAD